MAGSETHYTLPRPVLEKPLKLLLVVAPYYKDIACLLYTSDAADE